jgi:hypothetical protein
VNQTLLRFEVAPRAACMRTEVAQICRMLGQCNVALCNNVTVWTNNNSSKRQFDQLLDRDYPMSRAPAVFGTADLLNSIPVRERAAIPQYAVAVHAAWRLLREMISLLHGS